VDMSSVLTASRLLRAGAMPTGPARYVSGWELKIVQKLLSLLAPLFTLQVRTARFTGEALGN